MKNWDTTGGGLDEATSRLRARQVCSSSQGLVVWVSNVARLVGRREERVAKSLLACVAADWDWLRSEACTCCKRGWGW